jgi:hypothetical protein
MRRAARTDANQSEIVAALRQAGCSVQPLHQLGGGVPDLLVGKLTSNGIRLNYLLEVKDANKPPSKRQLTSDEAAWHQHWLGQVDTVSCVEEALEAVGIFDNVVF